MIMNKPYENFPSIDFVIEDITDIEWMVEHIKNIKRDDELAHCCEDKLRNEFIVAIKNGKLTGPVEAATLVLSTNDIDFQRWYA